MVTTTIAIQAAEAARILEGSGISIAEAARMAVARLANDKNSETFKARYARAMIWGGVNWRSKYLADMNRLPSWVPEWFLAMPCGAIDRETMERAIIEGGAKARSTIDMKLARVSAIHGFRDRHKKSRMIHILTGDQINAVLASCLTPPETWAVSLLLYAGIRPDAESGEISRLDWQNVGSSEIYVPQEVSKTGADRIIPVLPVLRRALNGRPESGSVTPPNWKRSWQRIRKTAGISDLKDVLRHTFASHFLAAFGEDATKQAMGHTAGSNTLFRHYRRAVTEADGTAFFQ